MARIDLKLPPLAQGLSARLLVLSIIFVLIGEVLIYVPSIARFRADYLDQRIEAARLAALTVEAVPDAMVSEMLGHELLRHAGVKAISLKRSGRRTFILAEAMPVEIARTYEPDSDGIFELIGHAFAALWHPDWNGIRVIARSPKDDEEILVDIVMEARPLREAMVDFSVRILMLSLVLAAITASLIYLSIHVMLVRPMRRITQSLVGFQRDPEDAATDVRVSGRRDEIGVAQRELHRMQEEVRRSLRRQARLAAVGGAVAKINHDLRNMLSTAALITERLALARDPEVQRLSQPLVAAIDRAVNLCMQTLAFARAEDAGLSKSRFPLRALADEVAADVFVQGNGRVRWLNEVPEALAVTADRDQLFRVLLNLVRNAVEAISAEPVNGAATNRPATVTVRAAAVGDWVTIDVIDTGPGLPERARQNLFEAFSGAGRKGGIGLGLVIARDVVRNHGGTLSLAETGSGGTTFRIALPDQPRLNQTERTAAP